MINYQLNEPKSSGDKEVESTAPPTRGAPNNAPDLPCIAGIDLHPDIFDCVELEQGKRAVDAKVKRRFQKQPVKNIVSWAKKNLDIDTHLIVIEATSNSFNTVGKLFDAGFSCVIINSEQTERVAETFLDDDQMAAERIGRCYLTGFAKVVWVPDEKTRELRDLLHAYQSGVTDNVRAINELKSFLTVRNIRPGKRNLHLEANRKWLEKQLGELSTTQQAVFESLYNNLDHTKANRDRFYRLICTEMLANKQMLNCLRVVGIGMINAFAIVAIVGDIKRFANPKKLVSYLGLNPGHKTSGKGKDKKKSTGNRGRSDMRALLIQAAQSVLKLSFKRQSNLSKWGFKLFARTGKRNLAVVAIARKLVHSLYHILSGRTTNMHEQREPMRRKLLKLSNTLKKEGRAALNLPLPRVEFISYFFDKVDWPETQPTT